MNWLGLAQIDRELHLATAVIRMNHSLETVADELIGVGSDVYIELPIVLNNTCTDQNRLLFAHCGPEQHGSSDAFTKVHPCLGSSSNFLGFKGIVLS